MRIDDIESIEALKARNQQLESELASERARNVRPPRPLRPRWTRRLHMIMHSEWLVIGVLSAAVILAFVAFVWLVMWVGDAPVVCWTAHQDTQRPWVWHLSGVRGRGAGDVQGPEFPSDDAARVFMQQHQLTECRR